MGVLRGTVGVVGALWGPYRGPKGAMGSLWESWGLWGGHCGVPMGVLKAL